MRATTVDVIHRGGERARMSPWRGEPAVAHLAPAAGGRPLSASFVEHCLGRAWEHGYTKVITNALARREQRGFLAVGFSIAEELHLLAHDLEAVPTTPPSTPLRRARAADHEAVLDVDERAFAPFWRLDAGGLQDALGATPSVRFRVIDDRGIQGYAITGRSGRRGYIQRLAVDPSVQRQGLGRTLVLDSLRWLRRWRAGKALVNTQQTNEAALALYESLGFRREASGLSVLALERS